MKLREKTLLIIGATLIGLITVLYSISSTIVLGSFVELEKEDTGQDVERVRDSLSSDLSNLDSKTGDWANWNDTYDFIQDGNQDFIKTNPTDTSFIQIGINLMLFVNSSGHVIYGKAFDLENEKEIPVPQSLYEHISASNTLFYHPDTGNSLTGLILLPEGPMLIASRPILTSEGKGPIHGTLIFGRYLDAYELKQLSKVTHSPLTAYLFNSTQMPPDFQEARASLSKGDKIFVQPLDEQSIAGYTLLRDVYGRPILILREDAPRDIYQQGHASMSYFILSLLVIGLVFGAVTMLLLEKSVLSRLAHLISDVGNIGSKGDLSMRTLVTGGDELSNLSGSINTMLDALEHSQHELRKSEERYRSLIETSPDAVMLSDQEGRILVANQRAAQLHGFKDIEEILRKNIFELISQEDHQYAIDNLKKIMETGWIKNIEYSMLRKDGTRFPAELNASLIVDTKVKSNSIIYVVRDITERKRAEEVLQRAHDELELRVRERTAELARANEILKTEITERERAEEELKRANIELKKADELKTQFLSIVSHELRTPITPMNAQLQMILAGYFGDITEQQIKSLEMIQRNTTRLDRLIGDVLDISRLEAGVMKFIMVQVNLNEIVENAVETMRTQAQNKNLKLTLKEDKIPEITIDKDRITQVIINLINNAIKFTDTGGLIEVELSGSTDHAIVKVKDNGIGIKKEDLEKLFTPFQQVDSSYARKYEGSGLGLAICKRIVTYHGGKIWVESEPGKGSAFQFTIPYNYKIKERHDAAWR
ncbi:MAG: ATP-binding protein [Candidatus Methanoperedens sp.]|nr:ATP-binding protein [Candidatus Methanoperedens sp.]